MKTIPIDNGKILIGQNQNENDIILRQCHQEDLWFHLSKGPSAHVILSPTTPRDPAVLQNKTMKNQCVQLVREHSKCAQTASVDCLARRHLKLLDTPGNVLLKKRPLRIT